MTWKKRKSIHLLLSGRYYDGFRFGLSTNRYRWAFLENGINNVMVKLEEGVDMKTVCFFIVTGVGLCYWVILFTNSSIFR